MACGDSSPLKATAFERSGGKLVFFSRQTTRALPLTRAAVGGASLPTSPVRRVFFGHLDATPTSVVQPGQLKVSAGTDQNKLSASRNNREADTVAMATYSCDSLGSGRPNATTGRKGVITMVSTARGWGERLKSARSKRQRKRQRRAQTVFGVRVEGRKLWLRLRDDLLPVHALLQSLEHALLSDSLNVPSEDSKATGELSLLPPTRQRGAWRSYTNATRTLVPFPSFLIQLQLHVAFQIHVIFQQLKEHTRAD